jgi:hypothetical protein
MKLTKFFSFEIIFFILLFFSLNFVSTYTKSYPGITSSGNYFSSNSYSEWNPDFDKCKAGQDFIIQIAPFGCSPLVVTSDLLEEENVPVFCQLYATKLNPLIDITAIEEISFKGKYPEGVSGVGFHPSRSALGFEEESIEFPIMENIGYVVIVLKKQESEKNMPDVVRGNLTAVLDYDIEDAFGMGKTSFYLPEIEDNSNWEFLKKFYSFWEGKGYLRAEKIYEDEVIISIYDGIKKVDSFNLLKKDTSKEIVLPGFDCLARFKIKLDNLIIPETRARLKIGSEYVEVIEGETFLKNRCRITEITKYGLLKKVEISCKEDSDRKDFGLSISPQLLFEVNKSNKTIEIGKEIFKTDNKGYYLVYVGSLDDNRKVLDTDETKDLIAYVYEKNIKSFSSNLDKLSEDELDTTIKRIDYHLNKYISGREKSLDFGSFKLIKYNELINFNNIDLKLRGYSNVNNEVFDDIIENDNLYELENFYDNANKDFDKIIESFSSEKRSDFSNFNYGEKSFNEALLLANNIGQKKRVLDLCDKLKNDYPSYNLDSASLCVEDSRLSSSESISNNVLVDGKSEFLTLYDVLEPSLNEYSVELVIDYPNNKANYDSFILGKNQMIYLDSNNTEYIQLIEVEEDSIKLKVKLRPSGNNKDASDIYKTLELKKGELESFGSDYLFSIRKINLKKYARVSIIPNIEDVRTEANFSFQIGIEKRSIKLSPEKTREKIEKLDNKIKKWNETSENLGGMIKTFKTACLSFGAIMIVKNLYSNLDGKSIARQKVMRDNNGWYDKCSKALSTNKLDGKKVNYVSLNDCFTENSEEIERDVNSYHEILKKQNQEIKTIQDSSNSVKDDSGILSFLGLGDKVIDTDLFMKDYIPVVREKLKLSLNNFKCSDDLIITSAEIDNLTTYNQWKNNYNYDIQDLKDLEFYSAILEKNPNHESAKDSICSIYSSIKQSSKEDVEKESLLNEFKKEGFNQVDISYSADEKAIEGNWNGWVITKNQLNLLGKIDYFEENKEYNAKIESYGGKKYLFILGTGGNNKYGVDKVFEFSNVENNKISILKEANNSAEISKKFIYEKIDSSGYKNPYESSGENPYPVVKYFETEPYKGLPSIVPFDLENGWYACIKQTLPISGSIGSYEDSGRVSSFYICNVGINNREDNMRDDDKCTMINTGTGQSYGQIPGFDNDADAKKLIDSAVRVIEEASRQYSSGLTLVKLTMRNGKKENIKVGKPQIDIPDIQCQDMMSPKDCQILFNVCDPVICPSSRCDLGGAYPVSDVIQSGIIGSIALCFPNYREGIYIPVCLTGIKAGIDSLLSVYSAYRDCLQESLDSGEMIGICDEIYSIHLCDFFWRQTLPVTKIIIPKLFEIAMGQNTRGGGEYMSVQNAWKNAEKSIDYFTDYYSTESYNAFKSRILEGVGEEICKNFISVSYPDKTDLLENLVNPDSPPQFHGRFDETSFTTTTNPPTSHYKVYYHIYAGKDSRAYYQVYLKGDVTSSYYQDTSKNRLVSYGYIAKGDYASETKDFIAPSGYKQLCIVVNGQEECGFEQISTSFAINYIEDKYLEEQALKKNIKTEKECISGSVSLYSLINPNIQSSAEEMINPSIYENGIIRICSTDNPGINSDVNYGKEGQRWVEVGYCDDENLKCWIDKESVKKVIENFEIENNALSDLTNKSLEILESEGNYLNSEEIKQKIDEMKNSNSEEVINIVNENYNLLFWNKDKAEFLLQRGKAYSELAQKFYIDLRNNKVIDNCNNICGEGYISGYKVESSDKCKSDEIKIASFESGEICCCIPKLEEIDNCNNICGEGYISGYKVESSDKCKSDEIKIASFESGEICCCIPKENGNEVEDRKTIEYDFKERTESEILEIINYAKDNTVVNRKCECGNNCNSYSNLIYEASKKYDIPDPILLLSVMMQESDCIFDKENKDSVGLMQISSWEICKNELNLMSRDDVEGKENIANNINCGAIILKEKYDIYKKGKVFQGCSEKNVKYYEWEAALRGYVGWGCQEGHDDYVGSVMERYNLLIKNS